MLNPVQLLDQQLAAYSKGLSRIGPMFRRRRQFPPTEAKRRTALRLDLTYLCGLVRFRYAQY
jgi:hypothetical protein